MDEVEKLQKELIKLHEPHCGGDSYSCDFNSYIIARFVLKREILARIEEIEEWGEGSFSSGEKITELRRELKSLED